MKTSDGAFHQCFNGQAVVDGKAQVIVAADLADEAPDARQLAPALDQLAGNLAAIGAELPAGATLAADAGYFSETNIRITAEHGLDPHIATARFKHTEPPPPPPRGRIATNATPKQRMARKLRTKKGRAVYRRRKAIVEPVFGQIDTVQNGQRLLLRGEQAARDQWRFPAPSTTCSSSTGRRTRPDRPATKARQQQQQQRSRNRAKRGQQIVDHAARCTHRWLAAIWNTRAAMHTPLPVTAPRS